MAQKAGTPPLAVLADDNGVPLGTTGGALNISGGSGGGPATIADGADFTQGAVADAESAAGNGTVVALLKNLRTRLAAAVTALNGGLPGALAAGGGLKVEGVAGGVAQPISGTVTADTELPAAAALTDGAALPATTPSIGAVLRGVVAGTAYNITAISTDSDSLGGAIGLLVVSEGYVWNGAGAVKVRTPNIIKPHDATAIAAEATVWDPAAGKKFRVMGYQLSSSVAGNILLKDGNGGATIAVIPSAAGGAGVAVNLGNGILSAAADNNLRAIGPAVSTLSGVIWGTEE